MINSNPVDKDYWEKEIREYLSDSNKRIFQQASRVERIANYFNREYRFYLTGMRTTPDILASIQNEVVETFYGCSLRYDDAQDIPHDTPRHYICVTIAAQNAVDSRGYLKKLLLAKIKRKELKLFFVFICLFAGVLLLFLNHQKGYADPGLFK
jgi:hypothetical protein